MNTSEQENKKLIASFEHAFNAHDIDGVMACMTDDCVYLGPIGPDQEGQRFEGIVNVREAILGMFKRFPDSKWINKATIVAGDHVVTHWTYKATDEQGGRLAVDGCDLLTLRNGKIVMKNAFRKQKSVQ